MEDILGNRDSHPGHGNMANSKKETKEKMMIGNSFHERKSKKRQRDNDDRHKQSQAKNQEGNPSLDALV